MQIPSLSAEALLYGMRTQIAQQGQSNPQQVQQIVADRCHARGSREYWHPEKGANVDVSA